ncbi:sensor histidine kinase [Rugamonas sp. CCM 8940]|uniref:sensor histidine kinase n=1 Tax=Rugamonas sp. CCM 8940 TaxID=2765359 RepID=UPI0018F62C14|nr:sensor histidine kinase [Rugamonas sp. CCM 8940]MBJ7310647.1 sensor histidine kinase [Rugamonas sp. CCM 8940]
MPSIRLRLLKWLIAPILLINLAGGALTYLLAWMPAQLAFDESLSDAAGALAARLGRQGAGWRIDLPRQAEQVLRNDAADAVYFVVRDGAGRLLAGDADFPPVTAATGTSTVAVSAATGPGTGMGAGTGRGTGTVAAASGTTSTTTTTAGARAAAPLRAAQADDGVMRGEPVRLLVLRVERDGASASIGVAKTLRKRLQVRQAIVRALVLLEGLLTLASVGLIWFSVTNGLLPLKRMRADLNARGGDDLAPIDQSAVPYELEPVVGAFNGLLDKIGAGAQAQHDFLANVAHQLRTPLAGLRTQLEWLAQRHDEAETAQSIRLMLSSTERMIRQTNQLLALARAEPSRFAKTRLEPLALESLVEEAIQHFVDQAALKRIDLGFELLPTQVRGDRFLLRDLIDNLIDNAIRYTPPRGRVTVGCRPDGAGGLLLVEDSGPGIAPDKRELVFSRFVRLDEKSSGSGLGLAIVRDIALAHAATLAIATAQGGRGALFSVHFPA